MEAHVLIEVKRVDATRGARQNVLALELGLDRHIGLWETEAHDTAAR
jgi:hypothetical protein